MKQTLKIGDKVNVIRKIGKAGTPHVAAGKIEHFSGCVKIDGECTAYVTHDDTKDGYWYKISTITPA